MPCTQWPAADAVAGERRPYRDLIDSTRRYTRERLSCRLLWGREREREGEAHFHRARLIGLFPALIELLNYTSRLFPL